MDVQQVGVLAYPGQRLVAVGALQAVLHGASVRSVEELADRGQTHLVGVIELAGLQGDQLANQSSGSCS